jgi:hypothetical protein
MKTHRKMGKLQYGPTLENPKTISERKDIIPETPRNERKAKVPELCDYSSIPMFDPGGTWYHRSNQRQKIANVGPNASPEQNYNAI